MCNATNQIIVRRRSRCGNVMRGGVLGGGFTPPFLCRFIIGEEGKEGEEVFSEAKSLLFKVGSAIRTTAGIAAVVAAASAERTAAAPF